MISLQDCQFSEKNPRESRIQIRIQNNFAPICLLSDEGKLNFALSRLYSTVLFTQDHKSFCFALLLLVHFISLPNIPNKINFSILAHHDTIIEVNKAKCLNSPFNSKSFVTTLGRIEVFLKGDHQFVFEKKP